MTETKKKNTGSSDKKRTTKPVNKNNGNKSVKTKKTESKPVKSNNSSVRDNVKSPANFQFAAVMICIVALIFAAIVFISGSQGTLWDTLRGFIFGLFGWSAYVIPFILFYISVILTYDKMVKNIGVKIAQGLFLFILIGSFIFVHSHSTEIHFLSDLKNEFMMFYENRKTGNGFFAAVFGELFYSVGKSKPVAYAIIIIGIFADFMFFTGFTLMRLFRLISKPVKKVAEIQKTQIEKYTENKDKDKNTKNKKPFIIYNADSTDNDPENDKKNRDNENSGYKITEFNENDAMPVEENSEIKEIFNVSAKSETEFTPDEIFKVENKPENDIDEDIIKIFDNTEKEKKLTQKEVENEQKEFIKDINGNEHSQTENYKLPSFDLLNKPVKNTHSASQADLKSTAEKLMSALHSFNVEGTISEIVPGPSVTRFEVAPAPGVKISKFTGLADDLALHLAAPGDVRIEAPIPNKSAIGIEIPNKGRIPVAMREIVESDIFKKSKSKLNVAIGKDIAGNVVCCDIAKMPHLLVAGTTGSGKSVCLNSMIISVLFNAKPSEVKLLLIDPKQVEFSVYNGAPHLLVPVVSDARKAAGALGWAVTEMLNRYKTLNETGVRDIGAYNKLCDSREDLEKMSQIMIVIDELSDLMSVAPSEVEDSITRLAQMARAAGMHLVVATQRPSVDVITGLIKANIPSRIALSVSSQIDSRTILDSSGAEKLLGLGDMLYAPQGTTKPVRVQGCFLSDNEIKKVVDFVKNQEDTVYSDEIQEEIEKNAINTAPKKGNKESNSGSGSVSDSDNEIIMKAAELLINNPEKASISAFQRNLSLGFAKAGRIMDELENRGIVGPSCGSKPRKVLITKNQWYEMNALRPDASSDETEESINE